MPTYLTPGVYVEEVDTGSKPLAAVGTAVAAFVGFTAKAPSDDPGDPDGLKPRLVTNWSQFERLYGGFAPGVMLRGVPLRRLWACMAVRRSTVGSPTWCGAWKPAKSPSSRPTRRCAPLR